MAILQQEEKLRRGIKVKEAEGEGQHLGKATRIDVGKSVLIMREKRRDIKA